jgi:hypothetical protein
LMGAEGFYFDLYRTQFDRPEEGDDQKI